MRIVAKNQEGQPYSFIGKLGQEDASILRRYWSGDKSQKTLLEAGEILSRVRDMNAWLACDCLGEHNNNPPILAPRKTETSITMQRLPGRPTHADECEFSWEEGEMKTLDHNKEPGKPTAHQKQVTSFILFKSGEVAAAPRADAGRAQHRAAGHHVEDALGSMLFELLRRSKLNVLDGSSVLYDDRMSKLIETAKTIDIVPGVKLSEVMWHHPDAFMKGEAGRKFAELMNAGRWTKKVPVQGYLIVAAKSLIGNTIETGGRKITITSKLVKYGNGNQSPYIVIVALKYNHKDKSYEAIRAYAHPVRFFRTKQEEGKWVTHFDMMPVDSKYERSAGHVLAKIARDVAKDATKNNGHHLLVEKPLFDIVPAGVEMACRPDFILRYGKHTAVIEVMGYESEEYLQRKAGTHQAMKLIGKLILDERTKDSESVCDEKLRRRVWGWLFGEAAFKEPRVNSQGLKPHIVRQ